MIRVIKTELWKLKRYSVLWIGVSAMLSVVLLTRFMAAAEDGSLYTLERFINNVIWNNFTLIYPAAVTLIAGYLIERERTDDTLKNLLTVPYSFRFLLLAKVLTCSLIAVFLAAAAFVFTLTVFFISGFPGFSAAAALKGFLQMIGMNLCVYLAVLPIILFTGQRQGTYMFGVAFTFFYGFAGAFASGHGLSSLYPISAGLGLIGYQGDGVTGSASLLTGSCVLLLIGALCIIMIITSYDRVKKQR